MQRGQQVGIALFSSIVAGTASMGVWQSKRYLWKVDLIEQRKKQLEESVKRLPLDVTMENATEELEYRPLQIEGSFVPNTTFYLYPRSPPIDMQDTKGRVTSGGYIYQLFRRANGTSVIVNRGWLPKAEMEQHMLHPPQTNPGIENITGIMVQGEEEKTFSPPNEPEKRHFFWLNQTQLGKAMGETNYVPILIEELTDEDGNRPDGEPLRKAKQNYLEFYMTPWKHAMYAGIWFTLALLGTGMVFYRFRSTSRRITKSKRS